MRKLKLLISTITITLASACPVSCITSCGQKLPTELVIEGQENIYTNGTFQYHAFGLADGKKEEIENVKWSIDGTSKLLATVDENGLVETYARGGFTLNVSWDQNNIHLQQSKIIFIGESVHSFKIKKPSVEIFRPNDPEYQFEAIVDAEQCTCEPEIYWEMVDDGDTSSEITSEGKFKPGATTGTVTIKAKFYWGSDYFQDEYTFNISEGEIITFEPDVKQAVKVGDTLDIKINYEVIKDEPVKGYYIEFQDKGTGAKFDHQINILYTNNAKPGTVHFIAHADFDPSQTIEFDVKIFDSFGSYQINSENMTASLKEFDKNLVSCKNPIESSIIRDGKEYIVTSIQDRSFEDAKIKELDIPDSIETFDGLSFAAAKSLSKINFGENSKLKEIGGSAIQQTNLLYFKAPKTLEKIGSMSFNSNENLKEVDFSLADKLSTIEELAFNADRSLEKVILPKNIKIIGPDAFGSCLNLKDIWYGGTIEQWHQIEKQSLNDILIHCTDGNTYW